MPGLDLEFDIGRSRTSEKSFKINNLGDLQMQIDITRTVDTLLWAQMDLEKVMAANITVTKQQVETAIFVEVAEFINELDYKWWKPKAFLDPEKIRYELVDIMHFVLLHQIITRPESVPEVNYEPDYSNPDNKFNKRCIIPVFINYYDVVLDGYQSNSTIVIELAKNLINEPSMQRFIYLAAQAGFDFPSMYTGYCIKNVVNQLRTYFGKKEFQSMHGSGETFVANAPSVILQGINLKRIPQVVAECIDYIEAFDAK